MNIYSACRRPNEGGAIFVSNLQPTQTLLSLLWGTRVAEHGISPVSPHGQAGPGHIHNPYSTPLLKSRTVGIIMWLIILYYLVWLTRKTSTVNLKVPGGKIGVKLIFVAKCSWRCQETTIWNPPESDGGGPPFYARKVFRPRAILWIFPNDDFYQHSQDRYANRGFLTRGIDSRWSQDL